MRVEAIPDFVQIAFRHDAMEKLRHFLGLAVCRERGAQHGTDNPFLVLVDEFDGIHMRLDCGR